MAFKVHKKQYQFRSDPPARSRRQTRSIGRSLSAASAARFAASWPNFRGRRLRQEWLNGPGPRRLAGYGAVALLLLSMLSLPQPLSVSHWLTLVGIGLIFFALRRAHWNGAESDSDRASLGRFSELSDRLEKRIEELQDVQWELSEKEVRYRDLLDTQSDMILRRNGTGQLTFVNTAFCQMFDVTAEDVIGRPFAPIVVETDGTKPALDESHRRQRQFTERVVTKAGSRWIVWDEQLITTSSDGDIEVQGVGRDVTQQRAQQEQLQEARDQAESANRAKSRFLAAMSHEIRTPMNGILGMSSLLNETKQTDEQKSYTRAIDQSARNLLSLIDEILDFSKIEAGALELENLPFVLEKTVQDAVELMAVRAREKHLDINWHVSPQLPRLVMSDEVRLRQIILNLVSNAIKFTDSGEITVQVEAVKDVCLTDGALVVAFEVRDTGIGLSKEDCRHLFSEFVQSDSAVRRGNGGTGLGLAISRRLALAMGGDITVESVLGQGSTFRVILPVGKYELDRDALKHACRDKFQGSKMIDLPVQQTQHVPLIQSQRVRVLMAEDNEINALLATRMIEKSGCSVHAVQTGQEAVVAMQRVCDGEEAAYDLVLMDIHMPGIDGVEAARQIKALFERPETLLAGSSQCPPILALTANAFEEDKKRYLDAGMDGYLAKPFDAQDLRALIEQWVDVPKSSGQMKVS
ncbi:MAG: ATP-binding protein [Hyphomicrobiaceae bacterium]